MDYTQHIRSIKAREILSSRGEPTVEVDIIAHTGSIFRASTPSGASTGANEVCVRTDGTGRYNGKAVEKMIEKMMNGLVPMIFKSRVSNQIEFDSLMHIADGTPGLSVYGGNCVLALSMAYCKFQCRWDGLPMYKHIDHMLDGSAENKKEENAFRIPMVNFNVLNGGVHSGNDMLVQEIMVCFGDDKFSNVMEQSLMFYKTLKDVIGKKYGYTYTGYGDEGGYMPPISELNEGLDLIREVCAVTNQKVKVAIDMAANSFYEDGKYKVNVDGECKKMSNNELIEYYGRIIDKYNEVYMIEDPFSETDKEGWQMFTSRYGSKLIIVGDDLLVTNPTMIKEAVEKKLCNAALIKPNQIGTVSRVVDAVRAARAGNFKLMVSHRSGETEDPFIAGLAVGLHAEYFKGGAPRGERMIKYNELLRISESLAEK